MFKKRIRLNRQITAPKVRLIDEQGRQVGIISTDEALKMAFEKGLALAEISPAANPPVCKLLNWGKYKYELAKEEQKRKKKQKEFELKGIRLSIKIGEHDLQTKIRQAEKFLGKGDKVKVTLIFKGREITHKDLAYEILNKFKDALSEVAQVEEEPGFLRRDLIMILAPKK